MSPERRHIERYRDLFVHQDRRFAIQTRTGAYVRRDGTVTEQLIGDHLAGRVTAGWYALGGDEIATARWSCVDADQPDGLEALQRLWTQFQSLGLPAYLEGSREGRGHLWTFSESLPARPLRRLVLALVERSSIGEIEVFPKQAMLAPGRVGSLVRGPLGVHRKTGATYPFVDPIRLRPVGLSQLDDLDYMMTFERVTADQVADTLARLMEATTPDHRAEPRSGDGAIARLKQRVSIAQLVGQYVELDEHGRGHCPWHQPDRHRSFSVNSNAGYFFCFHEWKGGDVVEFYRRLKGLTTAQAVKELSQAYPLEPEHDPGK